MTSVLFLATAILTNLAQVVTCVSDGETNHLFDVSATVSFLGNEFDRVSGIGLNDAKQDCVVVLGGANAIVPSLRPGDRIRVRGHVKQAEEFKNTFALATSIELLEHGQPPVPACISAQELHSGRYNQRFVSIRGTVIDTFRDEIDTRIYFVIINSRRRSVYAYFYSSDDISEWLATLVNAEVEIRGLCTKGDNCIRQLTGNLLTACETNNITVIRHPDDIFDSPESKGRRQLTSPDEVLNLDRHRIIGKVVATWQKSHVLLKSEDGKVSVVEMSANQPLPANGQFIESVGFAETDLYNINLSHAIWRPATPFPLKEEPPKDVSANTLLTDGKGCFCIDPSFHGKAVRLMGTVKSVFRDQTFRLETSSWELTVDTSASPQSLDRLSVGCQVAVTGTCVMDVGAWRPYASFPRVRGYTIVIRQPEDLIIVARAPWWTVERLLYILCAITFVLVGLIAWNRYLHRLVERRSRQLAREELAHAKADLRAEERTRLSVELHDTLSQSLAGISLQLDSVQLAAEDEPEMLFPCIETTQRSLKNCRENLRNCLWDLRSRALEERSLDTAIAKTLAPYSESADISVHCPISLSGKSDNAIHAILCIARELTVNAIRHGKATAIKVSAATQGECISLSVSDNGCGFDPQSAPGIDSGHFGLQGVSERIHQLGGSLKIDSRPGHGTKVIVQSLHAET